MSSMLVPSYALDGLNGTIFNETDYTQAQKDGYFGEGCNHYHQECPVSLFEVKQCHKDYYPLFKYIFVIFYFNRMGITE